MLTKKQLHRLEAKIFKSLQRAGWVEEGVFSEENGWRVVWTELGTRRVRRLREVIEAQLLEASERAPVAFTVFALGGVAAGSCAQADADAVQFWRECCEEIGLTAIAGDCVAFVRIIMDRGGEKTAKE